MKKFMLIALVVLVFASLTMAQNFVPKTYTSGTGIPFTIDKLGAHQNGGRGCVGCHAPHSGARGNGGAMRWDAATSTYISAPTVGVVGDEVLWGQDLGPIYGKALNFPSGNVTITSASQERLITGVAMCLSCHDGNVAKGAMMTNKSFEQTANLLPAGLYGTQDIPTLLGADGGSFGNYANDHPVGPLANVGALPIKASTGYFALDAGKTKVVAGASYPNSAAAEFGKNYGWPQLTGARVGAGLAVESGMASVDEAYVVCTTCHTPHSMYTASGTYGGVNGTYPSYFFIAAAYNPGADTANGTKASSATQFCRQCHFTGAGGSNEGSGISIPTAF